MSTLLLKLACLSERSLSLPWDYTKLIFKELILLESIDTDPLRLCWFVVKFDIKAVLPVTLDPRVPRVPVFVDTWVVKLLKEFVFDVSWLVFVVPVPVFVVT